MDASKSGGSSIGELYSDQSNGSKFWTVLRASDAEPFVVLPIQVSNFRFEAHVLEADLRW
jgi:hypothetical protein